MKKPTKTTPTPSLFLTEAPTKNKKSSNILPLYVAGNAGYLAGQPFLTTCQDLCTTKFDNGVCAFVSNRWTEGGSKDLNCSSINQSGSNCFCCPSGTTFDVKNNVCKVSHKKTQKS